MAFAPDSTQPGYLAPTTLHIEGIPFEDFLQDVICGITGMDETKVIPRYQMEPPVAPPATVDWCAFGTMNVDADYEPWINHYSKVDPAYDAMQRMERVTVLCSFYGPNSGPLASSLRDGIFVDQNRAAFRANGVGIIEAESVIQTSDLFRQQFRERRDLTLILRRETRRNYNVFNLVRAKGTIIGNDFGTGTVEDDFDTANYIPPFVETIWDDGDTDWDDGGTNWDTA